MNAAGANTRRVLVLALLCCLPAAGGERGDYDVESGLSWRQIREAAEAKGGLVVHIGCGDGHKTAEWRNVRIA